MKKQVNKATVQKLLISLGVAPSMNGYRYLTSAILLKIARESITMCGLYSEVAAKHNSFGCGALHAFRRYARV